MRLVRRNGAALAAIVLGALSSGAFAGGFAIITQSGSAVGNAFAGAAVAAEDATTVWYNPAGMAHLSRRTQLSVPVHAINTSFKFENTGSTGAFAAAGTGEGGNGGGLSLVPQAYFSKELNRSWTFGAGLNFPFGLKTEYDPGWRGQLTALKSELTAVNFNFALAYKASESLSLGGGLSVQYFETELTNFAGATLGTARLKADDTGVGFNLGAVFTPVRGTRVGVAYRSPISFHLEGDATFTGGGGAFNSGARADVKVPETLTFGVLHALSSQWDVMAGAHWTRWSRLTSVDIFRTSASPLGASGSLVSQLPFNWKNTTLVSVGASYKASNAWKLRFGAGYDPKVSNDTDRTPRLPDQSRLLVTAGARYSEWSLMGFRGTVDFSYAHEFIKEANINQTVSGAPGALVGKFENTADVLSVQVNVLF